MVVVFSPTRGSDARSVVFNKRSDGCGDVSKKKRTWKFLFTKKRSEGRGVFLMQEKLWHWCSSPTRGWRSDGSGLCSNLRSAVFSNKRSDGSVVFPNMVVIVVVFSQP